MKENRNEILKNCVARNFSVLHPLIKTYGGFSGKLVELFTDDVNTSKMKEFWSHIAVLWFVLLSITQARCKHPRKKTTRSVDTFNHKRKLDYYYPYRTDAYFRVLTEGPRYVQGNAAEVNNIAAKRFKRENNDTEYKRKLGQRVSHDSSLLPQPAKPLRVVATSAVIKNRRKKHRALKAIHIWGPTPFKTVLQNLQRLNNNIQKQRGAVKRLLLPVQFQRMQLLNALGKPPLPGPMAPFSHRFPAFNQNEQFPIPPDGIHLEEGVPPLPHVPGPMRLDHPPLPVPSEPDPPFIEPEPPFHRMGSMHLPELGPVRDFSPDREVSPVQELAPMHEIEPPHVMAPMNDIEPVHEMPPVQEIGPVRDEAPIPDIGTAPQLFPKSFDMAPNMAPNFEPPNSMFAPPYPWMAGEIHEKVNRHVNKGEYIDRHDQILGKQLNSPHMHRE